MAVDAPAAASSQRKSRGPRLGHESAAKSSRFLIWLGAAGLTAMFLAFFAWSAYQSYGRTVHAARVSIENLVLLLEEQTARTVSAVDMLLQVLLNEQQLDDRQKTQDIDRLMARLMFRTPQVKRVSLLNGNTGEVIAAFDGPRELNNEIDWEALYAHTSDPSLRLHVGEPKRDLEDRAWRLGISRRQTTSSGSSVIAVAHVSLDELQQAYDAIKVGSGGAISLYRTDAMLLVRKPYVRQNVGRYFPQAALFARELPNGTRGVFDTSSATDQVKRVFAFRKLLDLPLVVVAGLSHDEILEPWWDETLSNLTLLPLAMAFLLAFGVLFSREAGRRDEAEAQAKEKTALLEATLENMDQGLMMFDAEETVRVCNRRAMELLDLPPALMARRPSFAEVREHQLRGGEFQKSDVAFRNWVLTRGREDAPHSYERERPNGTVLEIRTVPLPDGGAVRTYTDVTTRRAANKQIAHMARHDALTDLPNRVLFRERMEDAFAGIARSGQPFALLCLDLDLFKTVNDTLGHPVGDALLVAVSKRIRGNLRSRDMVARLGGDEFAVLQIGAEQPQSARALASRLVEALARPFNIDGHQVNVGATIGIAIAPTDGIDPDQLFKNADLALYKAKAEGRDQFRFFEAAMDAQIQARRSLELDLRDALARSEFEVHYQGFVNVASGAIVGFEALLRWHHPRRGDVSPAEFIPVAEETGLIVQLGEWVLRQACAEAARWPAGLRVSVNVSAAQLRSQNLAQVVVSTLAASRLPPERLELEITETVLMRNNEASLQALHQLRGLGVRIAMDDFGTGYSSLGYLRSFPFDKIKIDRSFVRELGKNADCDQIVRAMLSLGARLNIATTAEGVETQEQLDFMRAEGCTEAQGYLLGRPIPAHDVLALLPSSEATAAA